MKKVWGSGSERRPEIGFCGNIALAMDSVTGGRGVSLFANSREPRCE